MIKTWETSHGEECDNLIKMTELGKGSQYFTDIFFQKALDNPEVCEEFAKEMLNTVLSNDITKYYYKHITKGIKDSELFDCMIITKIMDRMICLYHQFEFKHDEQA